MNTSILGQRITWTEKDVERAGVVWSAGPVTGTAWVIPDEPREDEGHAVCVRLRKTGHTSDNKESQRSQKKAQDNALAALRLRMTLCPLFTPPVWYRSRKAHGYPIEGSETFERGWNLERGAKDVRA